MVPRMSAIGSGERLSSKRFLGGDLIPDQRATGFFQQDNATDKAEGGDGNGVVKARVDIARGSRKAEANEGKQTAEDPVPNVIRQRGGRVANLGGQSFDKICGNGAVRHADQEDLKPKQNRE